MAHTAGWLALLAAAGACIWIASGLFWQLLPTDRAADTGVTLTGEPSVTSNPGQRVNLAALHLFGSSGMLAATSATFDAPDTSLDLRLVGTLSSEDPKSGMAMIADSEKERAYAIGDELPGNATLEEIYPDRVVLSHQGRYETLRLRDPEAVPSRMTASTRRPLPRTSGNLSAIRTQAPSGGGVNWQAAQQNLRINPAELAQQIRALPFMENGKQVGVRLQAGRDATLMSKLGLRNTDIITSVNGIPLDDPSRAFQLLNQLNSQSQFDVALRRDGREMTLSIDANNLQ